MASSQSSPSPPTTVAHAAELLHAGGLVAFPTETVYGLGADATNEAAVRRIFAVKGRPEHHPLIVHVDSAAAVTRWAVDVCSVAERLMAAFWPGPLTVVLRRRPGQLVAATGGRDTVGLRVPDHPLALALLTAADVPLAAPSANRFGRVSPTSAADVWGELGDQVDLVLDGGPSRVGVESTIIEVLGDVPTLLRPGGVPLEAIEDIAGVRVESVAVGPARASGMLASHYAPAVAVELVSGGDLAARAAAALASGRKVAVLAPETPHEPAVRGEGARFAHRRGGLRALSVPPSSGGRGGRGRRAPGGRPVEPGAWVGL